jgi:organic radical activating enzyme
VSFDPIVSPDYFYLEVTNHCNMHCTFCPSDYLQKGRRMADENQAIRFIEQVRDLGLGRAIQFNVLGEPLLNKQIPKYISLCEQYGIEVILITNVSILTRERVRRVLEHDNVALVLSLQTPTAESYDRMRGYRKIDFERYFALVFEALEEKFAMGSRSRIELHVASTSFLKENPTIQSDVPLTMWDIFTSPAEQEAFVTDLFDRFESFAATLRARFPVAYEAEERLNLRKFDAEMRRGLICTSRKALPPDVADVTEDRFWGYMFAPGCFIRFKTFGLWTKERSFLETFLPRDVFVWVEERTEPLDCPLAHNVSMLADGQLSLCCLDYEGEMGFDTIEKLSVTELLHHPRRVALAQNAMTAKVCRRCQGNLFIFETGRLAEDTQVIAKYGRGWHVYEPDLGGRGGRWTDGHAVAYVLARLPATRLRLALYSVHDRAAELTATLSALDAARDDFVAPQVLRFHVTPHEPVIVELPCLVEYGRLYRLEIESPVFVPEDRDGTADDRRLGLAIFDMRLQADGATAEAERAVAPRG